ncbi:MAG: 4Fe-4S ferredoxin, partial [Deltaproteobacteria bacterium]|nr:4Fe-4S ferredoxin [Deltaproteobacteria bacterium]
REGREPSEEIPLDQRDYRVITDDIPRVDRAEMRMMEAEARVKGFDEIALGFSEEEAKTEAARCLNCGSCCECFQCVKACLAGAVCHEDQAKDLDIEVGSVILAPGFEAYDPKPYEIYHYAKYTNVVTSLEFERILSASGPYQGHLVRPSDNKEPKK